MSYAAGTSVDPGRTRDEIERTLMRAGAEAFGFHRDRDAASIYFKLFDLPIVLRVHLPDPEDDVFQYTDTGRTRAGRAAAEAYEAEVKRRWRVLLLLVKAKLEAIELGLARPVDEFAMYVQMKDGRTVADAMLPQLESWKSEGKVAGLLPMF